MSKWFWTIFSLGAPEWFLFDQNGTCGEINTSALVCLEDKLEGQNNAWNEREE